MQYRSSFPSYPQLTAPRLLFATVSISALPTPALILAGYLLALSGCERSVASESSPAESTQAVQSPLTNQSPRASTTDTNAGSNAQTSTTKLRVKTEPVTQRTLDEANAITGIVQAFRKSTIAAEIGGRVSKRLVEPGAKIRANQILIQLDATQTTTLVKRAEAQVKSRRVDLQQAQYDLEKGQRLITTKVISQDSLDDFGFAFNRAKSNLLVAEAELADAQRQFNDTRIRAAFSGTAEVVHVQQGDYLSPGTPVVTLADFTKARVVAGVTANAAQYIAAQRSAQVQLQGVSTQPLAAKVQSIGRIADENGTFPVELWLEGDATAKLREGMIASVTFAADDSAAQAVLPRSALLRRGGGMFVYVLEGDVAKLRAVDLGRSDTNFAEVLGGVELGEEVVVDGLFALSDGARVELAD